MGKTLKFALFMALTLLYNGIKGCMDFELANGSETYSIKRPGYEINQPIGKDSRLRYFNNSCDNSITDANQGTYHAFDPELSPDLSPNHGPNVFSLKYQSDNLGSNIQDITQDMNLAPKLNTKPILGTIPITNSSLSLDRIVVSNPELSLNPMSKYKDSGRTFNQGYGLMGHKGGKR
ncbi:hypothetical protein K9M79_08710 [Candidatus Woesearchaeota archaeon]|nr:hypothetical protein [Candidatus Woesearchaeota archaeon]